MEGPYLLTVRAADGSVVRQRRYGTLEEIRLSDAQPTLEEMIAGHSGEVRNGRAVPWAWEPVNPKVLPLVEALYAAGIVTTGSGDLYGNDLVYVDLADGWEGAIAAAGRPPGWVVSVTLGDAAREALGLPPKPEPDFRGEAVEGVQDDDPEAEIWPTAMVRLSRRGGAVTPQEAEDVTASLLHASRRGPHKRTLTRPPGACNIGTEVSDLSWQR